MIRICFIGHKFHQITKSTNFIIDILKSIGTVDQLFSSPDEDREEDDSLISSLICSQYDCYIFLQTEYIAYKLNSVLTGRIIIIPMYDGAIGQSDTFWQSFTNVQFISFSRAHHNQLRSLQCKSAYFRYFPKVQNCHNDASNFERSAFFWERRPDKILNSSLIVNLCSQLQIERLHLHLAPDFGKSRSHAIQQSAMSRNIQITTSTWFESYEEFKIIASKSLFYFAPRLQEGIGMSFLEAMARGQIVIAPNFPTMNEYIAHGVTGILYDPYRPIVDIELSTDSVSNISLAARTKSNFGHTEWLEDIARFKSIVLDDQRRWSTSDYSSNFVNKLRTQASARALEVDRSK